MYLFKERLKEMISSILGYIIIILIVLTPFWLLSLIPYSIGSIIVTVLFLLILLTGLGIFLHWLFIEPFKESMLYWKIRNKFVKK